MLLLRPQCEKFAPSTECAMAEQSPQSESLSGLRAELTRLIEQLANWRGQQQREAERMAERVSVLEDRIRRLEAVAGPVFPRAVEPQQAAPPPRVGEEEPLAAELVPEPLEHPTPAAASPFAESVMPPAVGSPFAAEISPTAAAEPAKSGRDAIAWETFIGTKGLTWAGAFVLLVTVGFGVHWAWTTFETPDWLQVTCLHLLGVAIVGGGVIFHIRRLPIFAQGLLGVGIFTLYSVALATLRLYELSTETVAFGEFALITVVAVALALWTDSITVILLGGLGGYLAPILTSSGSGDYVTWFVYLAFLNVALAACAVWRGWSFLKPLSLAATALMFLLWIGRGYTVEHLWNTEWLLALHALIFLASTTIPPWAWRQSSKPSDLLALSGSSMWFLVMTWQLFHEQTTQQLALVCWAMAVGHLVLFAITYARVTHADRMPRLQLALSAVFVTLAAPFQLDDLAYLGPAWCVEGLIFTVVGIYFSDIQMRASALVIFALAAARFLGLDYFSAARTIGTTDVDLRFAVILIGGLIAMGTGGLYVFFREKLAEERRSIDFDGPFAAALLAGGNLLVMVSLTCQWQGREVLLLWTIDAAVVWALGFTLRQAAVRWYGLLLGVGFVGLLAARHFDSLAAEYTLLANERFASLALVAGLYFIFGWLYRRQVLAAENDGGAESSVPGAIAAEPAAAGARPDLVKELSSGFDERLVDPFLGVLANVVLVVALSWEVRDWFNEAARLGMAPFPDMRMARLATYSVLFAMYAAVMVGVGFVLRYRLFRLLGLAAFAPIVIKVFFVDLAELDMFPRVLAFGVLGMTLLGVSLLYQRFMGRVTAR